MNKAAVIRDLKRSLELIIPFFDLGLEGLRRSYAPGKWSIRELLCHLVDSETVFLARCLHILSEPGVAVVPFDQDKWARTLPYGQRDLALARRLLVASRNSLIEVLDYLPEAIFGRSGTHPEHPQYRAWDIVTKASTHMLHHYGQLVAARDGTPWPPPAASGDA
jgi:uncharacterized damage-inducible protein DinB